MNDLQRKVAYFKRTLDPRFEKWAGRYTDPAADLQKWLDECDADPDNVYDIGEPIAYRDGLLVMYNVEPVSRDESAATCNVRCQCGQPKKHYCRTCDAGAVVGGPVIDV